MIARAMVSNVPAYFIQWNCRILTNKVGELRERIRWAHLASLRAWVLLYTRAELESRGFLAVQHLPSQIAWESVT